MLVAGLVNDLWFNNYQFIVVTVWIMSNILWNLWSLFFPASIAEGQETHWWTLAMFGIASGFSNIYYLLLLPLTYADRTR